MSLRTVSTTQAPAAVGPYSQGVITGGMLFTAMQIGLDPATGKISGSTAVDQVKRCLMNIRGIVEASGSTTGDIVKTTIYLTDITQFADVNQAYAEFFGETLPARGVLEVSALPLGALIAVEAVAQIP